jgi:hypothetical protein
MNRTQIETFQRSRRNHLGKPLAVDGELGPQTQWALDVEAIGAPGKIINYGLEHVGAVFENGDNRHPLIDGWLLRCGVPVGLAWCAAFASACISAGGRNVHEASVSRLAKLLQPTDSPRAGDVGYWLNDDGTGHCWIWTSTDLERRWGSTVEGNSQNAVRCWLRPFGREGIKSLRSLPEPAQPRLLQTGLEIQARGGQTR